jgi:aryl-alcohol dehydrogenase-like predicted oxidoreductase
LVTDEGLGVIPYYALASGFLSGKYRSEADLNKSPRGQGIKKYLDERGLRILSAMDKVAADQQASLSEIAIAWLLHKSYIASPIASATNEKQLKELLDGAALKLSTEQINQLDEASSY